MAVELLKRVAERGEGDRGLTLAKRAFDGLDHHGALMQYLRLSAMGVEVGQSNAAWMLKHGYGCVPASSALLAPGCWANASAQHQATHRQLTGAQHAAAVCMRPRTPEQPVLIAHLASVCTSSMELLSSCMTDA